MSQSTAVEPSSRELRFFAGRTDCTPRTPGFSQNQSFPPSAEALRLFGDLQMVGTAIVSGDLGQLRSTPQNFGGSLTKSQPWQILAGRSAPNTTRNICAGQIIYRTDLRPGMESLRSESINKVLERHKVTQQSLNLQFHFRWNTGWLNTPRSERKSSWLEEFNRTSPTKM